MSDMRAAAIALANKGFRVVRLSERRSEKGVRFIPATPDWYETTTNDAGIIASRWTDLDGEAQFDPPGVETGVDCVVLDVDVKGGKRGSDSLTALELQGLDTDTLTATTPSGGRHLFYRVPTGFWYRSAVEYLPGLDVKGTHGYVVGVGAEKGSGVYQWQNDAPIRELPEFLLTDLQGKPYAREAHKPTAMQALVELDTEWAIKRAVAEIEAAPDLGTGNEGREALLGLANRAMDFGLSPGKTAEILSAHYPHAPLEYGYALAQVESLAKGRQSPLGVEHPLARASHLAFERAKLANWQDEGPSRKSDWPDFRWAREHDHDALEDRRWVVKDFLCRGVCTALISPPGVGKTTFVMGLLYAVATGRKDITGFDVPAPAKVWYLNQEDDETELRRRSRATRWKHHIDEDVTDSAIAFASGVGRGERLVAQKGGVAVKNKPMIDRIIRAIRENGIELFAIDPLVGFHQANENDNAQMELVMDVLRDIAKAGDCAVLIVAHTKKPPQAASDGFSGEMDAWRGASSQAGAARLVYTLFGVSEKQAKAHAIPDDQRRNYVELAIAKNNLGAKGSGPRFYRYDGVKVGGDDVGVLSVANVERKVKMYVDLVDILGKALATHPDREKGVLARELIRGMPDEDRMEFGAEKNWARKVGEEIGNSTKFEVEAGVVQVERRHGSGRGPQIALYLKPQAQK